MKYPANIMRMVRQNLDLESEDTSCDKIIEAMSKEEVFIRVCNWEGFIGAGLLLIEWINQIYGIDLNKFEE